MRKLIHIIAIMVLLLSTASCYRQSSRLYITMSADSIQRDTIHQQGHRYYSINDNFVVTADSLHLLRQQPEETLTDLTVDTFAVPRETRAVVADIRYVPTDTIDSVWVQLALDQSTWGWVQEHELMKSASPDDPISLFITTFSDTHVIIFLVVVIIIGVGYLMRKLLRRNAYIVHFNDIPTFYPSACALLVATAASLYASIQMFAPTAWQRFYFHPSLNPFATEPIIMVFLLLVWTMLIVAIATVDDIRHRLPFSDAILYLCGLAAVCALDYIVFSVFTLYYIGYPLLLAYYVYAIRRFKKSKI